MNDVKTNTNMIIPFMFTILCSLQRTFIVFELYNIIAVAICHYTEEEMRFKDLHSMPLYDISRILTS